MHLLNGVCHFLCGPFVWEADFSRFQKIWPVKRVTGQKNQFAKIWQNLDRDKNILWFWYRVFQQNWTRILLYSSGHEEAQQI
jgi:hypothetical protein